MMGTWLSKGLVTLLVAIPRGDDKPRPPTGPPPTPALAKCLRNGQILLRMTTTVYVPVVRTETIQQGGMQVTRSVTALVPETRSTLRSFPRAGVPVVDRDGLKIDPKDLPALLRKWTRVLISADGKPVDPAHLKNTRAGTLILILPRPANTNKPLPRSNQRERF